ncbi:MAG: hypothetical protein KR126chlam1_00555 [Chlamydiae bacterium]|nr:hypothetical protein [Chlamydiota bacterium]
MSLNVVSDDGIRVPGGIPPQAPYYPTEFHQIVKEFPGDIAHLVQKYPVVALVSMVVLGMLGFSAIFHFSISAIVTGLTSVAIAFAVGNCIYNQPGAYWNSLVAGVSKLLITQQAPSGN